MPKSAGQVCPENPQRNKDENNRTPQENQSFIIIPRFILERRGEPGFSSLRSSQGLLVLSIITLSTHWGANPCILGNGEISRRAKISKSPQSIHKILHKLERDGLIKRDGQHRGRQIWLTIQVPNDPKPKSVKIPPKIWNHPDLNLTQKLIMGVIDIRCAEGDSWKWYLKKLQITEQTYKLNLKKIAIKLHPEPYNFLYGNPIIFYKQPYNFLYPLIKGDLEDTRGNMGSKDPIKGASPLFLNDQPPHAANSGELDMKNTIPMQGRLTKNSSIRPLTNDQLAPPDPGWLYELRNLAWAQDHVSTSTTDDNIKADIKVLRALYGGLATHERFDANIREKIVHDLGRRGISRDQVEALFKKRFTRSEMARLFQMVSDSLSPAYGYTGTVAKVSVRDALLSHTGFSRIIHVWFLRPKAINHAPKPMAVPGHLEPAIRLVRAAMPGADLGNLAWVLARIEAHYNSALKDRFMSHRESGICLTFMDWLGRYLKSAIIRDNPMAHPGFLLPGQPSTERFNSEMLEWAATEARRRSVGSRMAQAWEKRAEAEAQALWKSEREFQSCPW